MRKFVKCVVSVPGFHMWKDAFDEVDYLKFKHRHVFNITALFEVTDNDREVEIIYRQNEILNYLLSWYGCGSSFECEFENASCEDLAEEILLEFGAYEVEVNEDGYGGAVVRAE